MDTWLWIVVIAAVILVVALIVVGWVRARARHRRLSNHFGREYEATLESADSRRQAERDLRAREEEHEKLELNPLSETSRARYEHEWAELQQRFVDRPMTAVAEADEIVTAVMRERGYPVDDFESKSRLVSVDHPDLVEHYRAGHEVSVKARRETASTEELRRAVIAYRVVFEELLEDGVAAN